VDVVPTRESELVELTRDYKTLDTAYTSLLAKREDSKIAANLERRQIGEQFRILDPGIAAGPSVHQAKRMGIIASGANRRPRARVPAVGWLEYRDSSLKREDDVVGCCSCRCWRSFRGDLGQRAPPKPAEAHCGKPGRGRGAARIDRRARAVADAI